VHEWRITDSRHGGHCGKGRYGRSKNKNVPTHPFTFILANVLSYPVCVARLVAKPFKNEALLAVDALALLLGL